MCSTCQIANSRSEASNSATRRAALSRDRDISGRGAGKSFAFLVEDRGAGRSHCHRIPDQAKNSPRLALFLERSQHRSDHEWRWLGDALFRLFHLVHEARNHFQRTRLIAQALHIARQFAQRGLAAIQSMMNACIQITTHQSAARHQQHAGKCHVTVGRTQAEIRVVQNCERAENAEHHMSPEPKAHAAEYRERRHALAQRVHQQSEHQRAARDAEPIAVSILRGQVMFGGHYEPCDHGEQRQPQTDVRGPQLPAPRFASTDSRLQSRLRRPSAAPPIGNGKRARERVSLLNIRGDDPCVGGVRRHQ